jgi:hypothetical protein
MNPMPIRQVFRLAAVIIAAAGVFLASAPLVDASVPVVFIGNPEGQHNTPQTSTSATGVGTVVLNAAETQVAVNLRFSGLTGNPTAGQVRGPAGLSAADDVIFDFSNVMPAATSGAIPEQTFPVTATQVQRLKSGSFYFKIRTPNGTGDISGVISLVEVQYTVTLSGAQEVPAVSSSATGVGTVALNRAEDTLFVNLSFSGLSSNAIAAHIHGPAARGVNGGVVFDLSEGTPSATAGNIPQRMFSITPVQLADLKAKRFYFNIHTTNNIGGEIRGQIDTLGPTLSADRHSLAFGATRSSNSFTAQTPAQTVRLTWGGSGTSTWRADVSQPWLTVSPASGTGSATLTIGVKFDAGLPLTGTRQGNVSFTGAPAIPYEINVTLNVASSAAPPSPPFGVFETPAGDGGVLAGSVAVTGWTLDNVGVKQVEIWRDLQPGETTPPFSSTPSDPRNGKIFIANATPVEGARPDVETLYPTTPLNNRAGWGYLMLTWGLFGQGNGTYRLYAFGVDQEGNTATIGAKSVVVSNNSATKPFGSIDTPTIGGDPGTAPNFGWALTPKVNGVATCRIPSNGVQASIDSGPLQPVVYGDARPDVADAFPGFSNSAAAGGHFIFDWSTLTNGAHTIAWLITDDCNRSDGVGSRFFNVTTGMNLLAAPAADPPVSAQVAALTESDEPITVARGYGELPAIVAPGIAGSRTIEIKQGERIELRTPGGYETAYQLANGQKRALPMGSTWDAGSGTFFWQPPAGFLGRFRLVFSNGRERISVRVLITP